MKIIAMIPARYGASRFPGKLMAKLGSKSVILRTYEAVIKTELFDDVYVVTDSDIIFEEIESHGGKAIMSKKNHETGSDRIAEAVADLDVDIVVNVQGDEPFTKKEPLVKVLEVFKGKDADKIDLASLMQVMTKVNQIEDPNFVKVVVEQALMDFATLPMKVNEGTEKIEALRYLEYGKKIKMVVTDYMGIEIDTPEDLEAAHAFLGEE